MRTSVDRWTPRELNKHISRAQEVCKTETLSTDIHTQAHHFDTRRLDQTLTINHKRLALCPRCHPAWASEGTLVGPGKDTHSTPVPTEWGGRGWPKRTTRRSKTRGLPSSEKAASMIIGKIGENFGVEPDKSQK